MFILRLENFPKNCVNVKAVSAFALWDMFNDVLRTILGMKERLIVYQNKYLEVRLTAKYHVLP